MKKKCLAFLLALVMCLSLLPSTASAADSDFTIENGVLTKYNGGGGNVVIPDGVTSIGDRAFDGCYALTSVTIPEGVTSIGDDAFRLCNDLTSVTIPNSVTSIGSNAFYYCSSLTGVTIPGSVTSIGNNAFSGCANLTSVNIQKGVTSIGSHAFSSTALTSVNIPEGVTSIGDNAFQNCANLTSVTIPSTVTSIGTNAFLMCTNLTSVNIPSSVTSINWWMFKRCENLTSVTIPEGVTEIGIEAFSGCAKLESVTIPSTVTLIEYGAFEGCTGLTDVYYGGSEAQWKEISIKMNNGELTSATIHYGDDSSCAEHTYDSGTVTKAPTCAAEGETTYTCTVCGETKTEAVPMVEHTFDEGVVTRQPTITAEGVKTYTCTVCGETKTESIPKLDDPREKFTDLSPTGFYLDAVAWAVAENITTGKTDTTFSPDENCTHGQILTFLWRAAGEPASDVTLPFATTGKEYYLGAAKWAYENGMIDGDFKHRTPCTRADAVNYIWQAFGKQSASYDGRFTDISTDSPYATAVAWALANGVTTGATETTFNPNGICNRGQIVTFLYRAYA